MIWHRYLIVLKKNPRLIMSSVIIFYEKMTITIVLFLLLSFILFLDLFQRRSKYVLVLILPAGRLSSLNVVQGGFISTVPFAAVSSIICFLKHSLSAASDVVLAYKCCGSALRISVLTFDASLPDCS